MPSPEAEDQIRDKEGDAEEIEAKLIKRNSSRGALASRGMSACSDHVRALLPDANDAMDYVDLSKMDMAVFQDSKWQNLRAFFGSMEHPSEVAALELLREGSRAFGFWTLPDAPLQNLVRQLREQVPGTSPALSLWIDRAKDMAEVVVEGEKRSFSLEGRKRFSAEALTVGKKIKRARVDHAKLALAIFIFIVSNLYAAKALLYPKAIEVFGVPVYFARAGGMGTALWTALLYLTMAKTWIKTVLIRCPGGVLLTKVFDAHKDLHVWAGKGCLLTGWVHIIAHCVGPVPQIVRLSVNEASRKKINDVIGCADPDNASIHFGTTFGFLHWPDCPLAEEKSYMGLMFNSLFGVTGVALTLLILIVVKTAKTRSKPGCFERFWYTHNFAIVAWPVLLFLHGSNGWLGFGIPLVVLVCAVPILLYSLDRIRRVIQYYGSTVKIVEAVVRPGKGRSPVENAMVYLKISKPVPWHYRSGMYAFINLPEYAPLQWHPFTICSSGQSEHAEFLIAAVGDWTRALAKRCLGALQDGLELPKVALDGPYASPTLSVLKKRVVVAVGAGVGITPLLSFVATIVHSLQEQTSLDENLELHEAHVFWMSRNADEFLFGKELIAGVLTSPILRQKIFFHLHVTAKEPEGSAAAYLFRECLRRQGKVDRESFQNTVGTTTRANYLDAGPEMPWCWLHGVPQDVLWVNGFLEQSLAAGQQATSSVQNADWLNNFALKSWDTDLENELGQGQQSAMIPIIFGRPDFGVEIHSIANAWPKEDLNIYVCGNDLLVNSLQEVCAEIEGTRDGSQRLRVFYERFG